MTYTSLQGATGIRHMASLPLMTATHYIGKSASWIASLYGTWSALQEGIFPMADFVASAAARYLFIISIAPRFLDSFIYRLLPLS